MPTATSPRPGLFIGSTSYEIDDIEAAIEHFISVLLIERGGNKGPFNIPAIPWGETTDHHWVAEQLRKFGEVPWLQEVRKGGFDKTERYTDIPRYKIRKGVEIKASDLNLLFLERAEVAWPILQRVCERHDIKDYYLEIGINTVDLAHFGLWHQAAWNMDPFLEKTRIEMEEIWELTGGRVRFIVEAPVLDVLGALTRGNPVFLLYYAVQLARLISIFPELAEWILHECNGRLGRDAMIDQGVFKKFFEGLLNWGFFKFRPKHSVRAHNIFMWVLRLAQWFMRKRRRKAAKIANILPIGVQFPFAFGSRPPSLKREDYEAYKKAWIPPEAQVYAGAISAELDLVQLTMLFAWFDEIFDQRTGMSSTCGHGSNDLETMLAEIDLMTQVAYV